MVVGKLIIFKVALKYIYLKPNIGSALSRYYVYYYLHSSLSGIKYWKIAIEWSHYSKLSLRVTDDDDNDDIIP